MTDTDVVVIGAGAAGIAAASYLKKAGINYILLEADDRLGGRAWTDADVFPGVPFDRGCHWLHSASINPLRDIADECAITYDRSFSFSNRTFYIGNRIATKTEQSSIEETVNYAFEEAANFNNSAPDTSVSDAVDHNKPWYSAFEHIFSLVSSGMPAHVSARDYAAGIDTNEDYPVTRGMGTLLLTQAKGLKVSRSTPVRKVDWSQSEVRVLTDKGVILTKAVIVTVSTAVLASGTIDFNPPMPDDLLSAIHACPLGYYEKVGLMFSEQLAGLPEICTMLSGDDSTSSPPISFLMNQFDRPVIVAEIGGDHAKNLTEEGEGALLSAAVDRLTGILGTAIKSKIIGHAVTRWSKELFIQGSYSYALPGMASHRNYFKESIGGQIFLAGEAVSSDAFATCHGAYHTGLDAAKRAIHELSLKNTQS